MDTNNSTPINNQGQSVAGPANPAASTDQQTTQYQNPNLGKGKSGRTVIILVVLLILVIGIGALLFVNSMGTKPQSTAPTVILTPSPTPVPPTPTPTEEFYIEDPEAEIKALDDAASTL